MKFTGISPPNHFFLKLVITYLSIKTSSLKEIICYMIIVKNPDSFTLRRLSAYIVFPGREYFSDF